MCHRHLGCLIFQCPFQFNFLITNKGEIWLQTEKGNESEGCFFRPFKLRFKFPSGKFGDYFLCVLKCREGNSKKFLSIEKKFVVDRRVIGWEVFKGSGTIYEGALILFILDVSVLIVLFKEAPSQF